MKKIFKILSVLFIITALFVACGNAETGESKPTDNTSTVYSNLTDEQTKKEITALLESNGVQQKQIETFISWVDDFNSRVTSKPLPDGYVSMDKYGADYSGVIIKNNEAEDGYIYPEANCRLTSYLLMKNMISTNDKKIDDDTYLMLDIDAIDTYEPFKMNSEEKDKFITLFNWVPVKNMKTLEEHSDAIKKAWEDRNIKIEENGISLITVYLHSTFDDVRFVGHTGVLLETDNGVVFVEKYGPLYPFQVTKFDGREKLKEYLLSRKDLYGDETELRPIIMENNEII